MTVSDEPRRFKAIFGIWGKKKKAETKSQTFGSWFDLVLIIHDTEWTINICKDKIVLISV